MSKQLPYRPSLEQLKNQARDLQKAHNGGAADTAARLRESLPRCAELSPPEIATTRLSLRDAQQVVAREYGFGSWKKLKEQVLAAAGSFGRLFDQVESQPEAVARIARALQDVPGELGLLIVALGEARAALVMKHLSDAEIEKTVGAVGQLGVVGEADRHRVLTALETRLSTDEPVADSPAASTAPAGHGDFILGALGQAVGQKRAREMMARQGVVAGGASQGAEPVLDQQYLREKAALIGQLQKQPAHERDLDGVRRAVVGLAEIARAEGVMALEEAIDKTQLDPLLRYGLRLAVDGTESHITEEMLKTRAETLVQELETRCRMIVAGVRAIQNDENPRIVDQRLESFYRAPEG